ncbi:MAG TPA: hypothetical protein DEP53_18240 [Bacteroidetes bacterium]|nr:hypothetical protein [Bacteroidota bacterium]
MRGKAVAFLMVLASVAFAQVDSLREMQRQLTILTEEIERLKLGEVSEPTYTPSKGLGAAATKVYQLKKAGVSIAGYGEVLYQNYSRTLDNGGRSSRKDQIDYLRNVIYFGYRYNDWILFNSEVEVEHGSTGKGGEVSVEFGYVELMFNKHLNLRAGMVLLPLGITNEKHEPSLFFPTLRPEVERSVIPTTWRANGLGLYGEITPSLSYRAYLVEGLRADRFGSADGIRGGRQSGAQSIAENLAVSGKLEYSGIEGTTLGLSAYIGNSEQGMADTAALTTVLSAHAEFAWKGFEGRGLYAHVSLDQAELVSRLAKTSVGSVMNGYYVSLGYDLIRHLPLDSEQALVPFVQYEWLNTHASVPHGFVANSALDRSILTVGLSYKPHPHVALKFDWRDNSNKANTGNDQWNIAVCYLY